MLIREDEQHGNRDDFYLTIPVGLGILDATWVHYDNVSGTSAMDIDGERIVEDRHVVQHGPGVAKLPTPRVANY